MIIPANKKAKKLRIALYGDSQLGKTYTSLLLAGALGSRILVIDSYFPGYPSETGFDIDKAEPPPRDESAPVYMDVRSVKNPSTKGRNVRYRVAAATGWTCEFTILWDKTLINRAQMESVLNDAGVLVGLADARAIGFGRFAVESFEILEGSDAEI